MTPTPERIREHFANFLDANLDDLVEDFVGIELDDPTDDEYAETETAYLQMAREIVTEIRG